DLIVMDLKDGFFTIPLHPDDCEKFAFTVPSVNRHAPAKRCQWVVLPQGIKNSPTVCQWCVDVALRPFRQRFPEHLIYHCMDDLLICARDLNKELVLDNLHAALK
ncbi:POK6 protein, partial [Chauna torquata]|nr:POK6 protein [Chauna torquata]